MKAPGVVCAVAVCWSTATLAQFGFQMHVQPAAPDDATPVTVQISAVYPNSCFEVCKLEKVWLDARIVQVIRVVVRRTGSTCFEVLTPVNSLVDLGILAPGVYTVAASENLELFDPHGCSIGFPVGGGELSFCVDSSCAASCQEGNPCTVDTCNAAGDGCVHTPVRIRHGDLTDNGVIDVDDILCSIDGFSGLAACPCTPARVDLAPCGGNGVIDVDDILWALAAFAGEPLCPDPCPVATYCNGSFGEICPSSCASDEVCSPNLVELNPDGEVIAALGCACRRADFCYLTPGLPGENPLCRPEPGCPGSGGSCAAEALVNPDTGHSFVSCDCFSPAP